MEAFILIVFTGFISMGFIKYLQNLSIEKVTNNVVNQIDPNNSNNNQILGEFKPDRYFVNDIWPSWNFMQQFGETKNRTLIQRKSDGLYNFLFTDQKGDIIKLGDYNDNDWNFQGATPTLKDMSPDTINMVNKIVNIWDWDGYMLKIQTSKYGQLKQLEDWKKNPEAIFDDNSNNKSSYKDQVGLVVSDGKNGYLVVTGLSGNQGIIDPENVFTGFVFVNDQNMGFVSDYAAKIYNANGMGEYVKVEGRPDFVKKGFAIVSKLKIIENNTGIDPSITGINTSTGKDLLNPYYNNTPYHEAYSYVYGTIYVNNDGTYTIAKNYLTYDKDGTITDSQGGGGVDNNNTFNNIVATISK